MNINQYFKEIENKVKVAYAIANEARVKGFDPLNKVEIPLATSLAGKVAALISVIYPQLNNPKLINRIIELEKEYGSLDPAICLKIAEEVAKEKFCKFSSLIEGIDAGMRIAFGYITLGVVAAPLEGYTHFKLKKTRDGKDYFAVYYAGPIGGAGRTAACVSLFIIDHLREIFGYAKYDASEKEIKRMVTEVYDRHERVNNLQYLPTEKEIEFLIENLPIQIDGDPTEEREVSNYKDLGRIETNRVRSGACLILAEGIAQKSAKALRILNKLRKKGFKLSSWDFLKQFVDFQNKLKEEKKKVATATYIKDLVAGRPVFGHPSKPGSFRLRYGRVRGSGYSSLAIHPATMFMTDGFIAVGTQLKTEKPTKGAAISVCDSIDGPIVKLNNGSVKKINDPQEAKKIYNDVFEIIYLGDILVPYGDFANRNHDLLPVGYTTEQWLAELKEKNLGDEIIGTDFLDVLRLSKKFSVPLHPDLLFFWSQISYGQFFNLLEWLSNAKISRRIVFPFTKKEQEKFAKGKRALELLGVEHEVTTENIILNEQDSLALLISIGLDEEIIEKKDYFFKDDIEKIIGRICQGDNTKLDVLQFVNELSSYIIKDKAGSFIGARMGRPEKAKLRKLTGSPHVLFPVGEEGGRLRSVQAACKIGNVKAHFPIYFCKKCNKETIYFICENCGNETKKQNYCSECQQKFFSEKCPSHVKGQNFMSKRIDIQHYLDAAAKKLDLGKNEIPVLIKGVRGTSSGDHVPENLAKGILRASSGLHVNKDGTVRYDATELPLTHFKPKEIETSVNRLRQLGYVRDKDGKPLESDEQILEIMPHDVILPACPDSANEKADSILVKVADFIDSLLVRFYRLKPFYNLRYKEDLIGHLVTCIAPHNCGCVVGRIIGFSRTQALLASPYMHAAMRRDCDGDEASFMLLLDTLINFSRQYLPNHRGATQDTPIVLNARIRAGEVDDMIFDFDVVSEYPAELYKAAQNSEHPGAVKIEQIKDRVGKKEFSNIGYTHETSDINMGVLCSKYKTLATMQEKVQRQMQLVEKIRSANTVDVARLIIERHFIRDIRGNLRKFSQQQFRCVKCNEKYRRPPLAGVCSKCRGKIIFTISEGSIVKYLEPALAIAAKYKVPSYLMQSLQLTKSYIESIFGKEKEKQEALRKWF